MTHDTLASWAESLPDPGMPLTADDLARLPDDGYRYELVEGRFVRMPPAGGERGRMSMRLGSALHVFVESRGLGCVTAAETGLIISRPGQPDTVLAPDAAFVRAERMPPRDSPEWSALWRLAPDLVVEVASPKQHRSDMAEKALRWLAAGTRLVWVVWPMAKQVDVWRPGYGRPLATLGMMDALDGLDVVPGFTYPVARLFA
jgi:Uma2 family endonuclease